MTAVRQGAAGQLPLFAARPADHDAWHVRVSARARRLSVRVYPGGRVEIVTPRGVAPRRIERFVAQHRDWIDRRVREFVAHAPTTDMPRRLELPGLGRVVDLIYHESAGRPGARAHESGRLIVSAPGGETAGLARALSRWVIDTARRDLAAMLASAAEETGLDYARVQVRRQRTRWGSCSITGTISLNACLAFQRPAVVRYLLIHELCHTRHMNHSQRYWSLVEHFVPDCRSLDRELSRGWQAVPAWMFR